MLIDTHKITALYFVKNPYRRDLDKFCTEPKELIKAIESNATSYTPIIYEVEFWRSIPKFKKLSKPQLKKLFEFNLAEKIPGRSKDIRYHNAAQKHERAYLPKRKTVRTYTKKKMLAAGYKRPAYNLDTTGTFEFITKKGTYLIKSNFFERENDTEDSLEIQNELRNVLGSIIIKNNSWRNLSNGKTIRAKSRYGLRGGKGLTGTLTKIK
jgi:hypothetical protein